MDSRFCNVTAEPMYALATLVDPRYQGKLFCLLESATAWQWLIDAASLITLPGADRATALSTDVDQPAVKCQHPDDIPSPLDLLNDELLSGHAERSRHGHCCQRSQHSSPAAGHTMTAVPTDVVEGKSAYLHACWMKTMLNDFCTCPVIAARNCNCYCIYANCKCNAEC